MAKRASKPADTEPRRSMLKIDRQEAVEKIQGQVNKGLQIRSREINTPEELKGAKSERYTQDAYNVELLQRIVDSDDLADKYRGSGIAFFGGQEPTLYEEVREFRSDMEYDIDRLKRIIPLLELIPESPEIATKKPTEMAKIPQSVSRRVFVVHGHDDIAKLATARTLEQLELEAIILHERPDMVLGAE